MPRAPASLHTKSFDRERFWAYAAAFGSLWGTLEVTLGAFLHTLRLPLTGAFLAAMGAALLVAMRQFYPARGSSLAVGVIAALLKSLSPGGVILGPMIGIISEAFLVELALVVAPRALLSAFVAGGLCVLWSVFQKVLTQTVLYGGTILDLYLAALKRVDQLLGSENAGAWLLVVCIGVLTLLGGSLTLVGRHLGRKAAVELRQQALPQGSTHA